METLKSILEKDQSKKTKSELIQLLTGIESILSPAVYEKISGLSPSELQDLPKRDILEILNNFKDGYDAKGYEKDSAWF